MSNKTSIQELASMLDRPFMHLELGQVNDHAAYILQCKGDYPFHRHAQDEMYLVLNGSIRIRYKNQPDIVLRANECAVVKAYTTHSPVSEEGALVLMIKPKEMFGAPVEDED